MEKRIQGGKWEDPLEIEKILRPRAAEDVHWNTKGYQIASTEEVARILPKLGLWPADMTGYVDQILGYEVEELYGISLGKQELETEDNSSSLRSNAENIPNGDNLSVGPSIEIDDPITHYEASESVTTDEEA
ncbi:hypothetical protein ACLOAV_000633 [Pseudogymnoascus australis]